MINLSTYPPRNDPKSREMSRLRPDIVLVEVGDHFGRIGLYKFLPLIIEDQ